ncbi:MAG: hypothetical protein EYC69_14785 [Bacteroidetes bacterium]|nr:MAG: hypothetical protein EYC69_14785 [Bacteroidota bacterium]
MSYRIAFSSLNKFIAFCALFFCSLHSAGQTNGDFRTVQNGNWNNPAIWETFNSGTWNAASYPPNQLQGKILIRHAIIVSADQVFDQATIDTAGSLNIPPGVTLTVTNSTDAIELLVFGTLVNSGMLFFSPSAILKIDSAGTYVHNSSVASSAVLDASQMHAQSNWIYRGNGNLAPPVTFSNRHYGNLTFESSAGSWSRTVSGSNPFSCTSLRIESNVMLLNNYSGNMTIHGDLRINGTLVNGSGVQKIILDGSNAQLSGLNLNNFFDSLTIQTGSIYSLLENLQVSPASSFTILGKLNCNSKTIKGNNNGSKITLAANAWMATSHPGGVIASIIDFSTGIFSKDANYEFTGSGNQDVNFYNPSINNLWINASPTALLSLKNSLLSISGRLSILSGFFAIDSNEVHFSGASIMGFSENLLSNEFSSMRFSGIDSAIYIPESIIQLKNLSLDKPVHDLLLMNDLLVHQSLSLQSGRINTGSFSLSINGNIIGGRDSSFVKGTLIRTIPASDSLTCFYPVGGNYFQPLTFHEINCSVETKLKVSAYESVPIGSPDGISLQGNMYNRYFQIQVIGNNGISSIGKISLHPKLMNPSLTALSKIGFSTDNTLNSFHGIGGLISSDSIWSTQNLSACQLSDLNSSDGSFIGIADEGNTGGTYNDSTCSTVLEIKVFIQGFYSGNQKMRATINPLLYPLLCDTIHVELHSSLFPYDCISTFKTLVSTDGKIRIDKSGVSNDDYFIVLKHRNSLETWSSVPVYFDSSFTSYDFSLQNKTFGNNAVELEPGVFGLYSGDIQQADTLNSNIQDGKIDQADLLKMEEDVWQISTGYKKSDLNGDGITDLSDYSLMENITQLNLEVIRP